MWRGRDSENPQKLSQNLFLLPGELKHYIQEKSLSANNLSQENTIFSDILIIIIE